MSFRQAFLFLTTLISSTLIFQNCGNFSTLRNSTVSGSCTTNLLPVFQNTYHSFFIRNNCQSCHAPNGVSGIPYFSDPNLSPALAAFLPIGPLGIDGKLSEGHQAYEYSSLADELKLHNESWNKAKKSCESKLTLLSAGQSLIFFKNQEEFGRYKVQEDSNGNIINNHQTIEFDLSSDSFPKPIAGVSLLFDIDVAYDDFFFPTYYTISKPRIISLNKRIRVKGLTILLDGKTYQVTTHTAIDVTVEPGSSPTELNPQAALPLFVKDEGEIYSNNDLWSIQLDVFEEL